MGRGGYFTRNLYLELQKKLMSVFNDIPYNRPGDPKRTHDDIPH